MELPRQPAVDELELAEVLHALSDPVRLKIVAQVGREGEVACGAFALEAPKSSLSHHFRVLRESGVLSTRRDGKELLNSLRMDALNERFPGLMEAVLKATPEASSRAAVD